MTLAAHRARPEPGSSPRGACPWMVALESVSFVTRRLFFARAASPEFGAHPSAKPETHHDADWPVAASRTTRGHRRPGAAGAFAVSTWGGAYGSSEATEFISSGLFAATLRAPLGESATEASVLGEKPSGRRARSPPCASTRWRRRSTSRCRRSCAWCTATTGDVCASTTRLAGTARTRLCRRGTSPRTDRARSTASWVRGRSNFSKPMALPSVVERLLGTTRRDGKQKQKAVRRLRRPRVRACRSWRSKRSRWTPSPGTCAVEARRRSTARGSGPNAPTGSTRRSRSRTRRYARTSAACLCTERHPSARPWPRASP